MPLVDRGLVPASGQLSLFQAELACFRPFQQVSGHFRPFQEISACFRPGSDIFFRRRACQRRPESSQARFRVISHIFCRDITREHQVHGVSCYVVVCLNAEAGSVSSSCVSLNAEARNVSGSCIGLNADARSASSSCISPHFITSKRQHKSAKKNMEVH